MIELPIIDPSDAHGEKPNRDVWRSLSQASSDPDALRMVNNEFMDGATDAPEGVSRRSFMQIMGASVALAGLTACRRPVETIVPYSRKPEEVIEGIPLFYATAMPFRGAVSGLLVHSFEGRPTKVEGNPEHPVNQGATGVFEQASVLGLYDPDRSKTYRRAGSEVMWNDFVDLAQQMSVAAAGIRLAVLSEETSSPTMAALRREMLQRYPQARWVTFPAGGDDSIGRGMELAFGQRVRPMYNFSQASVIVSLDADFLSATEPNMVRNAREFANSRRLENQNDTMSRLYVVESQTTMTGGQADHRFRLRASEIGEFAAALAGHLGAEAGAGAGAPFAADPFVVELARDLRQAGSTGMVLAGPSQPAEVHALCMAINQSLGSIGGAVQLLDTGDDVPPARSEDFLALVNDMRAGNVDVLLMFGVNPVYDAPADYEFAQALQAVRTSVHVGEHFDETATLSTWHLPRAHYLETWGDGRAFDGTVSVIQPLIAPLYNGRSDIEVLNTFVSGLDQSGYDIVRTRWQQRGFVQGAFEQGFRRALHDGFVPNTQFAQANGAVGEVSLAALPPIQADQIEVVFRLDNKVLDGRFANNAWLQELPEPVTKATWDNVAMMSQTTAERLGVKVRYSRGYFYSDVVRIEVLGRAIEIPAWIVPGHADNSITLTLGYGRQLRSVREPRRRSLLGTSHRTDVYGNGAIANEVGVNVNVLRTAGTMRMATGASVSTTGRSEMIATTQEHGSMEDRAIVRAATLEEFRTNPTFARDMVPPLPHGEPWEDYPAIWEQNHPTQSPAFKDNPYHKNQWGMVIDLNACNGCNACVIACTSENNVPVVGKEQVSRGRHMYWLRIDRYYHSGREGDIRGQNRIDDTDMLIQPMMCVHCENAPCEPVCPVAATSHSPDGINEMTYNRCIGTRYCSNNCPYKVRRFNFYNWTRTLPLEAHMAQNPNVTVRSRGVMEKCTYCVQRVRRVQRQSILENRPIQDGEMMTACQQACPARAITFGDLMDPTSEVVRQRQNPRRYEVLSEYNFKPRTSYLGRVRNPNPRLVDQGTA
jgi:MoCo/4Fe-4S cofactor protein with predicted Tat translocation signal